MKAAVEHRRRPLSEPRKLAGHGHIGNPRGRGRVIHSSRHDDSHPDRRPSHVVGALDVPTAGLTVSF